MGFEILDSGICLGRKTWQLLFFLEGAGVDLRRVFFLRIQKNLMSLCIMLLMKHKMFLGVSSFENSAWDIFFVGGGGEGYFLVQGFFWFCWKPKVLWLTFDFYPHSIIPVT